MFHHMKTSTATTVLTAALDEARSRGLKVAVAVVDASGDLVCFTRLDGCQLGSIDVAIAKARCAVRFKRPTSAWTNRLREDCGLLSLPGVLAVAGGLPLVEDDEFVGGIGVSGALPEEDSCCASIGASKM